MRIKAIVISILFFQSLFIVFPQAGQDLFANPALGDYFRGFVTYGPIGLALVLNAGNQKPKVIPREP